MWRNACSFPVAVFTVKWTESDLLWMSPVSGTLPVGYQKDALFSWLLSNGDTFSCYGGEKWGGCMWRVSLRVTEAEEVASAALG